MSEWARLRLETLKLKLEHLDLKGQISDVQQVPCKTLGASCDILTGRRAHGAQSMKVGIKRLRFFTTMEIEFIKNLTKEMYIWSKLRHRNIHTFLGYYVDELDHPNLISEWMENGNLMEYMEKIMRGVPILQMVCGIASGLSYLHEQHIVHADLKPTNIFISKDGEPLLADFGLSYMLVSSSSMSLSNNTTNLGKGTIRWMAPELIRTSGQPSVKSDIWALGMIIYELVTRERPYFDCDNDFQVMYTIVNGNLPACNPTSNGTLNEKRIDNELLDLCRQCWVNDPEGRLSDKQLMENLVELGGFSSVADVTATGGKRKRTLELSSSNSKSSISSIAIFAKRSRSTIHVDSASYEPHLQSPLSSSGNFGSKMEDASASSSNPGDMATDLQSFISPYLDQYVKSSNRLAFGERSVIVMSSKVAQKSSGETRQLFCPPPTAVMIGNSWWSEVASSSAPRIGPAGRSGNESERKLFPPRVAIGISGDRRTHEWQECPVAWSAASGEKFNVNDPPLRTTYTGRCVGEQLFIDGTRKKKAKALVRIVYSSDGVDHRTVGHEQIIGTFPSRSIKLISKPSKRRPIAKNVEMCITHGSTISLFHRPHLQTAIKYLCVSGSGPNLKGSDGAPLMGIDECFHSAIPSFTAKTTSWDPLIMYLVDTNKPSGDINEPPPSPFRPQYPHPPPNAIPFACNGSHIPIFYNQAVVLQCLISGVFSPVFIVRKVDRGSVAFGGGHSEGVKSAAGYFCSPGEVCGDQVSQLHKLAFEVYDADRQGAPEPGTPGATGEFLTCMGERVITDRPSEGRMWNIPSKFSQSSLASRAMSKSSRKNDSHTIASTPSSFPAAFSGFGDIQGSADTSPGWSQPEDIPGDEVANFVATDGCLWHINLGDASVWTIVGTKQVRYDFYVPPRLFVSDGRGGMGGPSYQIPSRPVTPFPAVHSWLPSVTTVDSELPIEQRAHESKMLTLYGENFSMTDPVNVFFGSKPSPYVEVRSSEIVECLPPKSDGEDSESQPIFLVRDDGTVFPCWTTYPRSFDQYI